MFKLEEVPYKLRKRAKKINTLARELRKEIKEAQRRCDHFFKSIKEYNCDYRPRLDGLGQGAEVIVAFYCEKCGLQKPITGLPFEVCRKCGGQMKFDRQELYGEQRVIVNKCQNCGHEYDTT